jgi:hypothetical protein
MDPLFFIFLCFANWRISSMVSSEEGPASIFGRLRSKLGVRYTKDGYPYGTTNASRGILCTWCVSVWGGILITLLLVTTLPLPYLLMLPLVLSTGAILLDVLINGR